VLDFWEGLIPERKKGKVIDLVQQMDAVIAGFVRGRLTICAVLILYYILAYWAIGVPAPLVVGLVVGALTLVPYAAGATVPVVMLLMWIGGGGDDGVGSKWWWIVGAPLVVLAIQQVMDDYVLTPRVQGKSTNMDTPTILFASIAGGVLAGFYGLLLAIPVAACIKIVMKEIVWPRVNQWLAGRVADPLPFEHS
jgi:predicted PurR-regulated permease PerM